MSEDHEQARVLVSLLVSITFLSFELSIRPLRQVEDHILAAVVQLALIILYTSILLIKVCFSSSVACAPFGFGDSPKGIFLFFVYFGLSTLLLQLVVAAVIMYTTGHVPKLLLLAKVHGVSPWRIFQRVSARRARFLKLRVVKFFRLNRPYLTPAAAAAVLKYRGGRDGVKAVAERTRLSQLSSAPTLVSAGRNTEVLIQGVFPRTKCFVQMDFSSFAIRWSSMHFISLSTVEIVQLRSRRSRRSWKSFYSPEGRTGFIATLLLPAKRIVDSSSNSLKNLLFKDVGRQAEPAVISLTHITFRDRGGALKLLEVASPQRETLSAWANALREVIKTVPRTASHAHWRWVLCCMVATSKRSTTGHLGSSELGSLLKRANANTQKLDSEVIEEAIRKAEVSLRLPPWLSTLPGDRRHCTALNVCQLTGMLLYLSCVSEQIAKLFASSSVDGTMTTECWCTFVRTRQFGHHESYAEVESKHGDETESADVQNLERVQGEGISLLQFALRLLSPQNNAVMQPESSGPDRGVIPLTGLWIASSHNSFIVGDQLTGLSSAYMYRRLLLICVRHVEIDCWEGNNKALAGRNAEPIVTHVLPPGFESNRGLFQLQTIDQRCIPVEFPTGAYTLHQREIRHGGKSRCRLRVRNIQSACDPVARDALLAKAAGTRALLSNTF